MSFWQSLLSVINMRLWTEHLQAIVFGGGLFFGLFFFSLKLSW